VVFEPVQIERRVLPGVRPMSATWDHDEAYRFVEELFAKHQNENLRVPAAHAPRHRASR